MFAFLYCDLGEERERENKGSFAGGVSGFTSWNSFGC